ncbi:hypothetical protein EDC65_2026 [Stella humosa]|uniref:Lipoprotein n=1 Tax=Stella humosa TaxID=94 RepID=A0A3N1MBU8_9PROT|nr:hypothetical protein [Stella humosa]ROQ00230.1 hypothetical protein EDC65_2026 [Stella humosa]BBK30535.1 hypothetical protein STHU_11690 [Stella humosa]
MKRLAALLLLFGLGGCMAVATPPDEQARLESDGECRNATPGNRLPFFRCQGDYDSFE